MGTLCYAHFILPMLVCSCKADQTTLLNKGFTCWSSILIGCRIFLNNWFSSRIGKSVVWKMGPGFIQKLQSYHLSCPCWPLLQAQPGEDHCVKKICDLTEVYRLYLLQIVRISERNSEEPVRSSSHGMVAPDFPELSWIYIITYGSHSVKKNCK